LQTLQSSRITFGMYVIYFMRVIFLYQALSIIYTRICDLNHYLLVFGKRSFIVVCLQSLLDEEDIYICDIYYSASSNFCYVAYITISNRKTV